MLENKGIEAMSFVNSRRIRATSSIETRNANPSSFALIFLVRTVRNGAKY